MIEPRPHWIAPACTCAFAVTVTRTISTAKRAALVAQFGDEVAAIWIDRLTQTAQYDETITTRTILHQCDAHAAFVGAEALWEELSHLEAVAHGADTCECRIAHWRDTRTEDPFTPVEHPEGTTRCPEHVHLLDTVEHHDVVEAENVRKNLVVNALAEALGVEAASFSCAYGKDRTALTITHPALPAATLQAAVAALPKATRVGDLAGVIAALKARGHGLIAPVAQAPAAIVVQVVHG